MKTGKELASEIVEAVRRFAQLRHVAMTGACDDKEEGWFLDRKISVDGDGVHEEHDTRYTHGAKLQRK